MHENIITSYFQTVQELSPKLTKDALEYFGKKLSVTDLSAKQFYIQANVVQKEIGFIHSGLIRAFYIDDKGNEKTVNFASEGQYASHYTNINGDKISKYYFQCLEDCVIINIPLSHMRDCSDEFPYFDRYIRTVVEQAHSSLLSRMEGFIFGTSETRYLDFIQQHPDWYNRIPLTYICSYLGIERQTLTRIRQKLSHR